MKAQVFSIDGSVAGDIELPVVFSEEFRPDLIKKAVISLQSTRRQPHGTYPYAGILSSAQSWGSGRGVAQVPRIKGGSRVAKIPQAKGGREAHPPVVQKVLIKQINKKEKQKAFRSALAATVSEEIVEIRGDIHSPARFLLSWKTGSEISRRRARSYQRCLQSVYSRTWNDQRQARKSVPGAVRCEAGDTSRERAS